eukprot:2961442-Pyramimonas_sp.AAC.1
MSSEGARDMLKINRMQPCGRPGASPNGARPQALNTVPAEPCQPNRVNRTLPAESCQPNRASRTVSAEPCQPNRVNRTVSAEP